MSSNLRHAAERARENAYVPYSGFAVGAAIEMEDGTVVAGANVENAAYPQSLCAERAAVVAAVSAGHRLIRRVYVVSEGGATPCGGCRSVLGEFGEAHTEVICADLDGGERRYTLGALLLDGFELGQGRSLRKG